MSSAVFFKLGGWSDTCLINFMGHAHKEKFPEGWTTLITSKIFSDWTPSLSFDDVIFVDDEKFVKGAHPPLEILRLVAQLRSKSFDVGFNLHRYPLFDRILKWGGVKKIFSLDSALSHRTDIEKYLDVLAKAGLAPKKLNFRVNIKKDVHEKMMRRLAALELRSKNFLVVAPGGGEDQTRPFHHLRWNHYAELISLFCKRTKYPVLLLGAQGENALALRLTAFDAGRVKSLVGLLNREETAAALSEAIAFIGNDAGPAFVAGSMGIPSVVLFGPTSSRERQPPGKGKNLICIDAAVPCSPCFRSDRQTLESLFDWHCQDNACMKSISPEQAWSALAEISNLGANGGINL